MERVKPPQPGGFPGSRVCGHLLDPPADLVVVPGMPRLPGPLPRLTGHNER